MEHVEYLKEPITEKETIRRLLEENSLLKKEKENLIEVLDEMTTIMKNTYEQAIEEIFEDKKEKNI